MLGTAGSTELPDGDKQDVMAEYDDKGDGDERIIDDNGVRYGLTELLVKGQMNIIRKAKWLEWG